MIAFWNSYKTHLRWVIILVFIAALFLARCDSVSAPGPGEPAPNEAAPTPG